MNITIKTSILIAFTTFIFSCDQNNKQIRFVNMQGNPGQLHLTTPSENLSALSKQGRTSEATISREKQYRSQIKPKKQYSVNKYAKETKVENKFMAANPATKEAKKNPELLYTVNMPIEDKKTTIKADKKDVSSKNIYIQKYDQGQQKSNTSNPRIISEIKIPGKKDSPNLETPKGIYVQVGSFRSKNIANSHLNKVKKITNNPSNVQIQEAKVKNKKYFRVIIGPITKKNTAKIIRKNLKEKGQDSIIIKVR